MNVISIWSCLFLPSNVKHCRHNVFKVRRQKSDVRSYYVHGSDVKLCTSMLNHTYILRLTKAQHTISNTNALLLQNSNSNTFMPHLTDCEHWLIILFGEQGRFIYMENLCIVVKRWGCLILHHQYIMCWLNFEEILVEIIQ